MSLRVRVKTNLDASQAQTFENACKRYCERVVVNEAQKSLSGNVKRAGDSWSVSFTTNLLKMEIGYDSDYKWVPSRLDEFYRAEKVREEAEGMGRTVEESINEDGEIVLEVAYA